MKKQEIATYMLDLQNLINKIEPDNIKAYQFTHYARKVIYDLFKMSKNELLKKYAIMSGDDAQLAYTVYGDYIANDTARKFFAKFFAGKITKTAYHHYNSGMGDLNLEQLRNQFANQKIDFFK